MNKKILASIFVIGILALAMGYGTYSYFSSTKKSVENVFTAGTINLQLKDADEDWRDTVYHTWSSPSGWAPGQEVVAELFMRNTGSTGVKLVGIHGENLNGAGGLADKVLLTTIMYTENSVYLYGNLIGYYTGVFDANSDGKVTLREFVESPYTACFWIGNPPSDDRPDYLPPNGARWEAVKLGFTFDSTAGDEYQNTWASFDLRVTALQSFNQITLLGWGPASHGHY